MYLLENGGDMFYGHGTMVLSGKGFRHIIVNL